MLQPLWNSMLSEMNQTQNYKYIWFHLDEVLRIDKYTEIESKAGLLGVGEGEMGTYFLMSRKTQFGKKKVGRWEMVMAVQQCKCS